MNEYIIFDWALGVFQGYFCQASMAFTSICGNPAIFIKMLLEEFLETARIEGNLL